MSWTDEGDIDLDDVRLHYLRRGRGPSVLLAHGAMDDADCWSRVADSLEDDFDLIAYDARSHGRSGSSEVWGDGSEDVVAVAEALGLERPAIVGHSMGAFAGAAALAAHPDRFRAAVLEDPPWMPPAKDDGDWAARARLQQIFLSMLEGTRAEIAARGRRMNPTWDEAELDAWTTAKTRFRPPDSWSERFDQQRPPWQDAVKKIECPVLLLCGGNVKRGRVVSAEVAAEAADICPSLEVTTFPEAGHNIRREAYPDYIAVVRAFLLAHS